MVTPIVAADLGKFNSVLCRYGQQAKSHFKSIRTCTPSCTRKSRGKPVGLVVFEACSQAGWVHDLCVELGLTPMRPS